MEIKNPRRILIVGPPDSGVLSLLKDLTGSAPEPRTLPATSAPPEPTSSPTASQTTTAGTSHVLPIQTRYYSASIPIWLDEAADPRTWAADFLTDEAAEVVRAVGAWIVVFRKSCLTDVCHDAGLEDAESGSAGEKEPRAAGDKAAEQRPEQTKPKRSWTRNDVLTTLTSIRSIISRAHGDSCDAWDGVCLAIGMPGGSVSSLAPSAAIGSITDEAARQEEWEERCWDVGFEYVDGEVGTDGRSVKGRMGSEGVERDEFGERKGLARAREALEANGWEDVGWEDGGGDAGQEGDELGWLDEGEDVPGIFTMMERRSESEDAGFSLERAEMEREFMSLKMAMLENEQDEPKREEDDEQEQDVEQLDVLLRNMLAVKEMSGHMTESERKRMARRVVGEVMMGGAELFE